MIDTWSVGAMREKRRSDVGCGRELDVYKGCRVEVGCQARSLACSLIQCGQQKKDDGGSDQSRVWWGSTCCDGPEGTSV